MSLHQITQKHLPALSKLAGLKNKNLRISNDSFKSGSSNDNDGQIDGLRLNTPASLQKKPNKQQRNKKPEQRRVKLASNRQGDEHNKTQPMQPLPPNSFKAVFDKKRHDLPN